MSGYRGKNRPVANGGPQGVQRSYASQLKEHEPLFNSYEHLQGLPKGDAALKMLRQVASLVKPIMRKRGWKVQILAEFLPAESNLLGLNINKGFKICIRLRYHNNPDLFLPLEQVVDTMLHELSHNVFGEHDSKFHRLWDELRDEWETLTRKGYTGEGFLGEGKKLGGSRIPAPHEMRRLARASAEKRQAQNKLSKGSGQKLGGTPLHLGGDIRQIIVDQVTRRNTISKGCGQGRSDAEKLSDQSANNSFKTKAEEDDANNRAIMQALYELMEEEEERKLQGTFIDNPAEGLAWHPENGLYDPRTEPPPSNGHPQPSASEEEQMKWALQESMQSVPHPYDSAATGKRPTIPIGLDRSNTVPSVRSDSKPSPVSATQPGATPFSPVSPMSPEMERHPPTPRKRVKQSSLSSSVTADELKPGPESSRTAARERPRSESNLSPIIGMDISEPFDPTAAPPDQWTCEICTCINPLQFLACDACGMERPERIGIGNRGARPKPRSLYTTPSTVPHSETLGWSCTGCGAFMEHRWWTCSACGKMKENS
jgi:DNA-dependent metalloprotease WSS1